MSTQNGKPCIYDLDFPALEGQLANAGQPAYRARQVWLNLYQGLSSDPAGMTDLPGSLRSALQEQYVFEPFRLHAQISSANRKTRKFLFLLPDDSPVETVLMSYDRRETGCISMQSGCAIGCPFCATGQMGLRRSLTAGEIIAQVLHLARLLRAEDKALTNLVVMGMGEPFLNYEATMAAVDRVTNPEGFGLGARRITLSTVGIVPGIRRFAGERRQVNLAISLHAADDELRDRLVPINRSYPLAELFAACDEYIRLTNRRLSLEWALIEGVNDSAAQAHHLVSKIRKLLSKPLVHVNLIPLNPTRKYGGAPTKAARVSAFQDVLEEEGIACTVRLPRGISIGAGCGQLAGEWIDLSK
jgi:23S rRNA (adenine2503-C2)-methyltransferase